MVLLARGAARFDSFRFVAVHVLALSLPVASGCVHTAPCPSPAAHARRAPAPAASGAGPEQALQDVTWRLRLRTTEAWSTPPSALFSFSVGRWECALGEVQSDDERHDQQLRLSRARRLACTHSTGVTVQTQLRCALQLAAGATEQAGRELELTLDEQLLGLACAPAPVEQLTLIDGKKQSLGVLCRAERGWRECAGAPAAP
jgi:hypothetical protein